MRFDIKESVTTTELVRNLSVVIDRVRLTGRRLAITKGSQTVAELSPPAKGGYPIARLGELLGGTEARYDRSDAVFIDALSVEPREVF